MATEYGRETIDHASQYWLERTPFTTVVDSLGPGASIAVFAVAGWNPGSSVAMVATLYSLGITQYPNLQVQVTADGVTDRYFADEFPEALQQMPMGHTAVKGLYLTLINNGTTTLTNIQVMYICQSWRAPVAFKILRGYPLTKQEEAVAKSAGLSTNANRDEGLFPLPLDYVIERSYKNRSVRSSLAIARSFSIAAAATQTTIGQVRANTGEALILRSMGFDADFDDSVQFFVTRDDQTSHIQVAADQFSVENPQEVFVTATSNFTFLLQSATIPPANVPARIEVLRVSLDLILDLRLKLITSTDVATVFSQQYQSSGMTKQAADKKAQQDAVYLATGVAAGVR